MKQTVVIDAMDHARTHLEIQVEVRVINVRIVKIRLWLAVQICKLAAWVGGIGLKINQEVGVIVTNKDSELDVYRPDQRA